jgi:hypothetical protein
MKTTGAVWYEARRLFCVAMLCGEQQASHSLFGRAEANQSQLKMFQHGQIIDKFFAL